MSRGITQRGLVSEWLDRSLVSATALILVGMTLGLLEGLWYVGPDLDNAATAAFLGGLWGLLAVVPALGLAGIRMLLFRGVSRDVWARVTPRWRWALWAFVLVAGVVATGMFLAVAKLGARVTDAGLLGRYVAFGALLAVVGAVLFAGGVAGLVVRWSPRWLVEWWSPGPLFVWCLGFPLPWLTLALVMVAMERTAFMPAARFLVPLGVLAWSYPLAVLLRRIQRSVATVAVGVAMGMLLFLGILTISGVVFSSKVPSKGPMSSIVFSILHPVLDGDNDGYLPLFDGKDCNDGDARVHSMAYDVPGNGVDEDCDGSDAQETSHLGLSDDTPALIPEGARSYNVVWIMVDALRADHLKTYGYKRRTSPNIDRLARTGLLFENAVSQYPSTGISVPSQLSGRYPEYMDWGKPKHKSHYVLESSNRLVTDILKEHGYRTSAVVAAWVHKNISGLATHFDDFTPLYPHKEWKEKVKDSSPIAAFKAIKMLDKRKKGQPFFLFVHFEDPHEPYENHEDPGKRWGKKTLDRYDSDVYWSDLWIGVLLAYLKNEGLDKDTIIVLTADHGEEFGEHGGKYHGHQIYQESIHVPLILTGPGVPHDRVETRVALVDLPATLLDLVGIEEHRETLQGKSLLKTAATKDGDSERPIFSMLSDRGESPTRRAKAVFKGAHKLIVDETLGTEELYDLRSDPGELMDLSGHAEDIQEELRELLGAFLDGSRPTWKQY